MAVLLPRFIVLEANDKLNYLSYVHDGGELDRYLRFSENQAQNPYAKFEVELSDTKGLVHVRSCQNNKYWERPSNPHYITATADNKEEDQSKESCTLFRFLFVDAADQNRVRIQHVQSGCYLCLWYSNNPALARCVLAEYTVFDHQDADIFTVIDWNSMLFLPKYVVFKGIYGGYVCVRYYNGLAYLEFAADDIADPTVACEIFPNNDGTIRIKQISNGKFWMRSNPYNWILAQSDDTSSRDTLFRSVKVDGQTIALINLDNNRFCKRLTARGGSNSLNADIVSVDVESRLTVEEAVLKREIYGVNYSIENARVYDETILVVAKTSASNYTQEPSTLQVDLSYTDTTTRTWNTTLSLTLGMKASMEVKFPFVSAGGIEISTELQSGVEWGTTTTVSNEKGAVHTIEVPPMTKTTVSLIATQGRCDVPFTFIQRDTLFDGSTVINEVEGGTYIGSNYSSIVFDTKEEKLE
ncbi:hypothetical protein F3Y22_tig00110258pilonHSYRG00103 [Hibiscus syriacus]|uniref:Agglutinin domain-containing protein n=1 Tax=Hibiscus syriacus TaxID=106335 RepID=A0A6A3BAW6_HIBSY|nr:hypothetical protein F3Y22_tig00110258pilonHSYRG00103 [Hibiscus syriacus]